MLAPESRQRRTSATISSGVIGRLGFSACVGTIPVMAALMISFSMCCYWPSSFSLMVTAGVSMRLTPLELWWVTCDQVMVAAARLPGITESIWFFSWSEVFGDDLANS